jgi:hypothetical protein
MFVSGKSLRSSEFEPLGHSVYVGRLRIGRYERISKRRYAAFDAFDRLIGRFATLAAARNAFRQQITEGER